MGHLFMPLTIDKSKWDMKTEMVFVDKIYEQQLTDVEKETMKYTILPWKYIPFNRREIYIFSEEMVDVLYPLLNQYNHVEFSRQYWYNMMVMWLDNFIHSVYFSYERIKCVSDYYSFEDLYITSSYKRPSDFMSEDFGAWLFGSDEYISSIQSNIASLSFNISKMDLTDEYRTRDEETLHLNTGEQKHSVRIKSVKQLLSYVYRIAKKPNILILNDHYTQDELIEIVNRSKGRIQPLRITYKASGLVYDKEYRDIICKAIENTNVDEGWKKAVLKLLAYYLPALFVEKYTEVRNYVEDYLNKNTLRAIKTSIVLAQTNIESFFAQHSREMIGCAVINQQEGGGFETYPSDFRLYRLSDYFYAYGPWVNDAHLVGAKSKIAPTPRFSYYNKNEFQSDGSILFISCEITSNIRLLDEQVYSGIEPIEYYNREVEFIDNLKDSIRERLLVRNYMRDRGWHIDQNFEKRFPDVNTAYRLRGNRRLKDSIERKDEFAQQLKKATLYISDYAQTTFLEALYLDKPIILMIPRQVFFKETELTYFKLMEQVGIIHYDPVETADYVSQIYDRIEEWWNEPQRRKVMEVLRNRYITKEQNISKWWCKELLTYIN